MLSVKSLQLHDTPIISVNDKVEYNWDEQVISLTPEAFIRFKGVGRKMKSVFGLPFIVVTNQQIIYMENIYPMYSSYLHRDLPFISVAPLLEMRIEKTPMQSVKDIRIDESIYNVMKRFNKVKM